MNLTVITPVGPGHEQHVSEAEASVSNPGFGFFQTVKHIIVRDEKGSLGRSRARNIGIEQAETDWLFFLDADDRMKSDALCLNDFDSPATFGAVSLDGRISKHNVFPCSFPEIALMGARGTLSMGFFCRADIAKQLMFNERMDAGEDFEFYMRLPAFTKLSVPLVDVGYSVKSAGGPRGYEQIDWIGVCNEQILRAVKRDPHKFNCHAVLAQTGDISGEREAAQVVLS